MISLSGTNRQLLFNGVIDLNGIESSGAGGHTLKHQSGKQSVAGKLKISTKLCGV